MAVFSFCIRFYEKRAHGSYQTVFDVKDRPERYGKKQVSLRLSSYYEPHN